MLTEFKAASHLYLKSKGFEGEFMTSNDPNGSIHHGSHFNFSLWNSDGGNVLVNPDNPQELSQFGRHWLAGLVEHAPALTALSSPTVNCYR